MELNTCTDCIEIDGSLVVCDTHGIRNRYCPAKRGGIRCEGTPNHDGLHSYRDYNTQVRWHQAQAGK